MFEYDHSFFSGEPAAADSEDSSLLSESLLLSSYREDRSPSSSPYYPSSPSSTSIYPCTSASSYP